MRNKFLLEIESNSANGKLDYGLKTTMGKGIDPYAVMGLLDRVKAQILESMKVKEVTFEK